MSEARERDLIPRANYRGDGVRRLPSACNSSGARLWAAPLVFLSSGDVDFALRGPWPAFCGGDPGERGRDFTENGGTHVRSIRLSPVSHILT